MQNLGLDEFLVVINARDVEGFYIVPKPDVATRLASEVEKRTGCKSRNLAGANGMKTYEHWISAAPGPFITETRIAIDGVCKFLTQKAAKDFEMVFHNIKDQRNWGDRVFLAVRYKCAA